MMPLEEAKKKLIKISKEHGLDIIKETKRIETMEELIDMMQARRVWHECVEKDLRDLFDDLEIYD